MENFERSENMPVNNISTFDDTYTPTDKDINNLSDDVNDSFFKYQSNIQSQIKSLNDEIKTLCPAHHKHEIHNLKRQISILQKEGTASFIKHSREEALDKALEEYGIEMFKDVANVFLEVVDSGNNRLLIALNSKEKELYNLFNGHKFGSSEDVAKVLCRDKFLSRISKVDDSDSD